MDYASPPTIFVPQVVVVPTPGKSGPGQLFPRISQGRRAVLIVNRGSGNGYLGSDGSVTATSGFLLKQNDAIAVATMAEVWATPGTYHLITLSK